MPKWPLRSPAFLLPLLFTRFEWCSWKLSLVPGPVLSAPAILMIEPRGYLRLPRSPLSLTTRRGFNLAAGSFAVDDDVRVLHLAKRHTAPEIGRLIGDALRDKWLPLSRDCGQRSRRREGGNYTACRDRPKEPSMDYVFNRNLGASLCSRCCQLCVLRTCV